MKRSDLLCLSGTSLFKGIDIIELDRLLKTTNSTIQEYGKGRVFLLRGCRYDSLSILLEGRVYAEIQDPSGRIVALDTIEAPDAIATGVLFAPGSILPVTVSAATDVRCLRLPRESVLALCQSSQAFLVNYLKDIGLRLSNLAKRFRLTQFASLREKIAAYLIELADNHPGPIVTLPFPKERLAAQLGVARPSLSRELISMAHEGLIRVKGRDIEILDRRRIEGLVAES